MRRASFLLILFALIVIQVSLSAEDAGSMDISNKYDLSLWPEKDTAPCVDYVEPISEIALNAISECGGRLSGKAFDYSVIVVHALAAVIVPELAPAVAAEFIAEGKKDATYCIFAGIIDYSDATDSNKTAMKAALHAALEIQDTKGDVSGFTELGGFLKQNKDQINLKGMDPFRKSVLELYKNKDLTSTDMKNASLYLPWNYYGFGGTKDAILEVNTALTAPHEVLENEAAEMNTNCEFEQAAIQTEEAVKAPHLSTLSSQTNSMNIPVKK
jgi:hypothetical protein